MLQSNLFTKTKKEAPKNEVSKNAILLSRAGFIHKEMAGVYSFLPLGWRVMQKIMQVIREEMNVIGGQELFLTSLQIPELWSKTNRWSVVDNWFTTKLKNGADLGLAFTHEEPLTNLMKEHLSSYRDLPFSAYQFQTKFRNEERAKSGIMRTREFIMKDLYSFSKDEKEHQDFYEKAKNAYIKIFKRLGLEDKTYTTFASGGTFSKYSHEFQTLTSAGEDTIYIDRNKKIAVNKEVYTDKVLSDLGLKKSDLEGEKAVEVGNIFSLGTRFSESFDLNYLDEKGEKQLVVMGSYGIGPGRLMGTIVEVLSDEKGIVWPSEVAPFAVHLLCFGDKSSKSYKEAKNLYRQLQERKIEVLFDDREMRAGEKFADSDLIGIPLRVVVSDKTIAEGKVEVKSRGNGGEKLIEEAELFANLEKHK
ncbi:MAG: aminoacyl--tRNA ligase-related protein [Patescibacteria group bacterium]